MSADQDRRERLPEEDRQAARIGDDLGARGQRGPGTLSEANYIAEHTVAKGETLSDIASKYYGSAAKEKWTQIYEANKGVIGDDPSRIRSGQQLKIPKPRE